MTNLIKGLRGDYEIHEVFAALVQMENEKIAEKIAANLHPCPEPFNREGCMIVDPNGDAQMCPMLNENGTCQVEE